MTGNRYRHVSGIEAVCTGVDRDEDGQILGARFRIAVVPPPHPLFKVGAVFDFSAPTDFAGRLSFEQSWLADWTEV